MKLALIVALVSLTLVGCNQRQETVDCGKQGVQEIKKEKGSSPVVVCKNGKVFQLN